MSYLLSIAIGPVQGFIAAARKTRDLWAGSTLLSQAAANAARQLQAGAGAELIFPDAATLGDWMPGKGEPPAVANKLFVCLDGDPRAAAELARTAAVDVLNHYLERSIEVLGQRNIDWPLARRQIATLLEFYAAWVPFERDRDDYRERGQEVERLLAGRKLLRDFVQPETFARPARSKSSLDAGRESVLTGPLDRVSPKLQIKQGELLDGVSLIKRVTERPVVSVSRIAADAWLRRARSIGLDGLAQKAQALAVNQHTGAVRTLPLDEKTGFRQYDYFPYDTQLLYDDGRFDPELVGERPDDTAAKAQVAADAAALFAEVRRIAREPDRGLTIGMPSPYLAILSADGDSMGNRIAELATIDAHKQLSRSLTHFANSAGAIVARFHGAMVYSGGDDVLAFLPLDTMFGCADALQREFRAIVGKEGLGRETAASLSVGIAVGHYGEHLQNLLGWSKAAEIAAKRNGRDRLAVALHTRSGGGEGVVSVTQWEFDPAQRWKTWLELHQTGQIPAGAAYEIRGLAKDFAAQPELPQSLVHAELQRILARRRERGGTRELRRKTTELMANISDAPALKHLVDELLVARRLASELPPEPKAVAEAVPV